MSSFISTRTTCRRIWKLTIEDQCHMCFSYSLQCFDCRVLNSGYLRLLCCLAENLPNQATEWLFGDSIPSIFLVSLDLQDSPLPWLEPWWLSPISLIASLLNRTKAL